MALWRVSTVGGTFVGDAINGVLAGLERLHRRTCLLAGIIHPTTLVWGCWYTGGESQAARNALSVAATCRGMT